MTAYDANRRKQEVCRRLTAILAGLLILSPANALAACTSPAANAAGMIYNSTYNVMQYCNGTVWVNMGTPSGLGALTAGNFCTADGTLINCATPSIDLSGAAASGILAAGRFPALTGVVTTTAGSLTTSIANGAITRAMQVQGVARSVIGVTGNATADVADIQGTANQVLRVNSGGTALAFGAIDLASSAAATGVLQAASFPILTGDVTTVGGTLATTLATGVVTNLKLANMNNNTVKGNVSGGTAAPSDLTGAQITAILSTMTGDSGAGGVKGLVPPPSAGDAAASKFLKADGTWAVVATSPNAISQLNSDVTVTDAGTGSITLTPDATTIMTATAAGVGIGSTPAASAILDVTSTTKGFLPPRMTTAQRTAISSPAAGLMVYDTTMGVFMYYSGSAWVSVGGGLTNGAIVAFSATSCPSGWSEYTAARGRFLRGYDNSAGVDPDGNRAGGATQADALGSHTHAISFPRTNANQGTGALAAIYYDNTFSNSAPNAGITAAATGSTETRPKNVAVIFCSYNGSGNTGTLLLSGMGDVQLTSPSTGNVLTYNGTKWVNSGSAGGSIAAADSNVTVSDGGTGAVTIATDGATRVTVNANEVIANNSFYARGQTAFSNIWNSQAVAFGDGYGFLGTNGSYRSSWMWNGYRNTSSGWTSLGLNGYTSGSGIELGDDGIRFMYATTPAGTAPTVGMTLNSSRNVGIGAATDTSTTARLWVKGSGTTAATYSFVAQNSSSAQAMVVTDNPYVGIGTIPGYLLDVGADGSGSVASLTGNVYVKEYSATNMGFISAYDGSGAGNIGLTLRVQNAGTATNGLVLNAAGGGTLTGTLTQTSDRRMKTDIQPLEGALLKVNVMQGVSFHWKDKVMDQAEHIGFIAQDVERIFPQAVTTDQDGMKSVDYSGLVAPVIEAVKELFAASKMHDSEIAALHSTNDNLMRANAELKAQMKALQEFVGYDAANKTARQGR